MYCRADAIRRFDHGQLPNLKAIVVVHYNGLLCDMEALEAISKKTGVQYMLPTLEDLDKSHLPGTAEWTSDWVEPNQPQSNPRPPFIGFVVKRDDDEVVIPAVSAEPNYTFRVKLAPIPKK